MAPHHQPQAPELFFIFLEIPHFKMESIKSRRLHGEVGSTRRISDSPNASISMHASISMSAERERYMNSNPSHLAYIARSPAPLYKAPEALVGFSPGKGSTDHHLSGRYADPGRGVRVS